MENYKEQKVVTWRILEIDKSIRNGEYPNAKTFYKKWGISRSTVSRYIEFLRDTYQAPIEYDYSKNGYYYTDNTFFIQNVMLKEGELFTISAIMPLLEQYKNTPLEASFKNIMSKITDMLPNNVSVDSYFLNDEIKFISDPLPRIEEGIFEDVFSALKVHKTLKFEYRTISSQEYNLRTFDPYHVICQKGNWYVIGYSHDNDNIRVYSFSRMKNSKVTKDCFSVPSDFNLENHIDPYFGIWNSGEEPEKIELEFDKNVSTLIIERDWHKNQFIKQNENGNVYLSFETNQIEETLHWVMQFCGHVKVLNPPSLREKTFEAAKKILEK
ncbi:MAG: helix-turn-helix transcriptional regulator [Treponemataceae bacterium]